MMDKVNNLRPFFGEMIFSLDWCVTIYCYGDIVWFRSEHDTIWSLLLSLNLWNVTRGHWSWLALHWSIVATFAIFVVLWGPESEQIFIFHAVFYSSSWPLPMSISLTDPAYPRVFSRWVWHCSLREGYASQVFYQFTVTPHKNIQHWTRKTLENVSLHCRWLS